MRQGPKVDEIDQNYLEGLKAAKDLDEKRKEAGLGVLKTASLLEVKADGYYVFVTVNGVYQTAHLRRGRDYSHLVRQLVDGPFEDMAKPDGKLVLSGHKLATIKMAEILASK